MTMQPFMKIKMGSVIEIAVVLCCCLCWHLANAAPEYQFSFGRIAGVDKNAEDTLKPYYAYYGIPFAQPPVGGLRFRAPRPFRGNNPNTVISSNNFRSECVQFPFPSSDPSVTSFPSSEDCLHLNVFTPTTVNSGDGRLKKVMLFIHGGGYVSGSSNYYIPSRMVTDYDVIVVTIQYRLGLFGFLDPGNGEANFGLRDQILSTEWVRDNIRQFGGDGNDITLFGESAGAGSIAVLALSPLAKGLFSKAILQSGTALAVWAVNKHPEKQFLETARNVGCLSWLQEFSFVRERYIDDIMDCLRTKSSNDILYSPDTDYDGSNDEKGDNGDGGDGGADIAKIYGSILDGLQSPTVDGVVIPRSPDILMADRAYLQANGVLDRSYIVGFNNQESIIEEYKALESPENAETFVKVIASFMFPRPVTDDVMDLVVYEYTYPRGNQDKPDVLNVFNVYSDVLFSVPAVQFARALASVSDNTPIYMYLLDHYPELVDPNGPLKGSVHTLDLLFEFDRNPGLNSFSQFYAKVHTPTDQPLYNIVRNSITQFAKTGTPSSQEYPAWPRFRLEDQSYLAIARNPEVRQRVFGKRMDLWTRVLPMRASQSFRSRGVRLY